MTGAVTLHEFITMNRNEIIGRCRSKVATRRMPPPTEAEIDHGVPMFLDQLVDDLRIGLSGNSAMNNTATQHVHDLRAQGFTVSQVVHHYGDVCQSITEMAVERDAQISADDFRMLNKCLDDAISSAVTEFSGDDEKSVDGETERVGLMVQELRNSVRTVKVALEAVKSGRVGLAGSTGTVLDQHILGAERLIDRLFAEVHGRRRTDPANINE